MDSQVIRLPAQFGYTYHKTFSDECAAAMSSNLSSIELDFSRVEYLDSSALGMLVLLHKKALDKSIKVSIKGAKGASLDILKMANMQKLFDIS